MPSGCRDLPPRGELVVEVDVDVAVPELASRLRIDVYALDGTWLDSREVFRGNPSDWPASFGLRAGDDGLPREALLRVRAYAEGATRPYIGEGVAQNEAWNPPEPKLDAISLCTDPPQLALGGTLTLRRGRDPIFAFEAFSSSPECAIYGNGVGSVAARIEIEEAGQYRFGVVERSPTQPRGTTSFAPQVTLELRRDCLDDQSGIDCTPALLESDQGAPIPLAPQLDVALQPGTYYLVTGGALLRQGFTDLTLAAWSDDIPAFSTVTLPAPTPPSPGPWLRGDPDRTPPEEPAPRAAIDRLARITIEPERVTFARLNLTGACTGRPSRLGLAPGEVNPAHARTCIDADQLDAEPRPPGPAGGPSRRGTFAGDESCVPDDSTAERVCIPSGTFVQGARRASGDEAELHRPATTVALHRFWIDRYELTVADYRRAVTEGLALQVIDQPSTSLGYPSDLLGLYNPYQYCTWTPEPEGLEAMPLNCITWYGARSLCQHRGGDLPTGAQWVYTAYRAGRDRATTHPWGEANPSCRCAPEDTQCREVSFGRDKFGNDKCLEPDRFGPVPPVTLDHAQGDTNPLGVVGLASNLREWTLDAAHPLDHPCFGQGVWDRQCEEPYATARLVRGTSFLGDVLSRTTYFWQPAQNIYDVGVRCVYETP